MSHFFSFKSSCKLSKIAFHVSQFDVGSSRHQLWKQYEFMINNREQAVAGGYESRSWLCMLRPHGRGRHHIVSCGHERTFLVRIVPRISDRCALHLQPEIHCTSALFIQITVTGRSCQCHHLVELRSCLRQPPHNQRSRPSVGVLSRDTSKFEEGEGRWLPRGPSHESDCVTRQIERKGDADGRTERSPCCCNRYRKWRFNLDKRCLN